MVAILCGVLKGQSRALAQVPQKKEIESRSEATRMLRPGAHGSDVRREYTLNMATKVIEGGKNSLWLEHIPGKLRLFFGKDKSIAGTKAASLTPSQARKLAYQILLEVEDIGGEDISG